jgi:hypothetical protein
MLGCNQQVRLTRKRLKKSAKLVKLLYWKKTATHSSPVLRLSPLLMYGNSCFERGEEELTKKISVQTERQLIRNSEKIAINQGQTCPILYASFIKSCSFYIPVVERKEHCSLFFI